MRTLTMNEIGNVSGASAAAATGIVLGVAAIAIVSAYYANTSRCYTVETPYSVSTPVYDPNTGVLLGHVVDDYIRTDVICP